MGFSHVAALALFGWYLMIPPTGINGWPNSNAPILNWTVLDSFDTALACSNAQRHFNSGGRGTRKLTRFRPQSACVATDDPRLSPIWGPFVVYGAPSN
jgi:hypothetical protein